MSSIGSAWPSCSCLVGPASPEGAVPCTALGCAAGSGVVTDSSTPGKAGPAAAASSTANIAHQPFPRIGRAVRCERERVRAIMGASGSLPGVSRSRSNWPARCDLGIRLPPAFVAVVSAQDSIARDAVIRWVPTSWSGTRHVNLRVGSASVGHALIKPRMNSGTFLKPLAIRPASTPVSALHTARGGTPSTSGLLSE